MGYIEQDNNLKGKQEENPQQISGKPKLIIITGLFILISLGFFIYYTPFLQGGIAGLAPELREEVNIILIGIDDESSDNQLLEADALIMTKLEVQEPRITFESIDPGLQLQGRTLKDMSREDLLENIGEITEIKPNYYFILSYQGFKDILNELRGVEIILDQPLEVPELGLYLEEGPNLLSGKEALNYARWYDLDNESSRIKRQQQIIKSTADKVLQTNTLTDIPGLYRKFVDSYDSVETNLDRELVVELIDFLRKRNDLEIVYEHKKREQFFNNSN